MNRSVTKISAKPMSLILLAIVVAFATPTLAQTDVAALRVHLVESNGGQYIAVRDQAVGLPATEFAGLLELLEAADPISQDRLLVSCCEEKRNM